jgi:hypothetical protein
VFELTSNVYRFRSAVAAGELFEALGLPAGASKLDVDVAGARLAEQAPQMAPEISRVVNILTQRQRRARYEVVRKTCDGIMADLETRHRPSSTAKTTTLRKSAARAAGTCSCRRTLRTGTSSCCLRE